MDNPERDETKPTVFAQLQKRKVFRAAIGYAVATFVILQIIDAIGEAIGIASENVRWIVAGLMIGFPIVVVFAWYFEISTTSMHLDDRFRSMHISRPLEIFFLIFLFSVAIMIAIAVLRFGSPVVETRLIRHPVIAVLPFITPGMNNSILGHGLPDQLLTRLDKITEYRVLSRTSSFSDALKGKDIRHISRELGADHILEGSIQQDGDRVLINTQLIDSATGLHVWSASYDRIASNILDLEIEIAQDIAKTLNLVLSKESQDSISKPSTTDPEAYALNIQGWNYYWRPHTLLSLESATELFEKSAALDAKFLDPLIGQCQSLLALYRVTLDQRYFERGRILCEPLAKGTHRSVDVNIALGDLNRALNKNKIADTYYRNALAQNNQRPDAYEGLANVLASQGNYALADRTFEDAILNALPTSTALRGYGFFLSVRGQHAKASEQFEQVLRLLPDDTNTMSNLGLSYFYQDRWQDAEQMWQAGLKIKRDFPVLFNLASLHYYQQRYAAAEILLQEILTVDPKRFIAIGKLASIKREQNNTPKAVELFTNAIKIGTPNGPIEDKRVYGWLASYHANLGHFEESFALLQKMLAADPKNPDAHYYWALTLTLRGDYIEAQQWLDKARQFGYSATLISKDPVFKWLDENQNLK